MSKSCHLPPLCQNYIAALDPNVMEIGKDDAHDFVGALDYLYKKATPAPRSAFATAGR